MPTVRWPAWVQRSPLRVKERLSHRRSAPLAGSRPRYDARGVLAAAVLPEPARRVAERNCARPNARRRRVVPCGVRRRDRDAAHVLPQPSAPAAPQLERAATSVSPLTASDLEPGAAPAAARTSAPGGAAKVSSGLGRTQADASEAVFEGASLSPAAFAGMQAALKHVGYDPGPIDGIVGPRTVAAVAAFQAAERLYQDGRDVSWASGTGRACGGDTTPCHPVRQHV